MTRTSKPSSVFFLHHDGIYQDGERISTPFTGTFDTPPTMLSSEPGSRMPLWAPTVTPASAWSRDHWYYQRLSDRARLRLHGLMYGWDHPAYDPMRDQRWERRLTASGRHARLRRLYAWAERGHRAYLLHSATAEDALHYSLWAGTRHAGQGTADAAIQRNRDADLHQVLDAALSSIDPKAPDVAHYFGGGARGHSRAANFGGHPDRITPHAVVDWKTAEAQLMAQIADQHRRGRYAGYYFGFACLLMAALVLAVYLWFTYNHGAV